MTLYWPDNQTNPNLAAIRNLFGSQVDSVTPAPCPSGDDATDAACRLVSHALPLLAVAVFLLTALLL